MESLTVYVVRYQIDPPEFCIVYTKLVAGLDVDDVMRKIRNHHIGGKVKFFSIIEADNNTIYI